MRNEFPITFTWDMIEATLEGRKTQTRRRVKLGDMTPEWIESWRPRRYGYWNALRGNEILISTLCPYGQCYGGQLLWVREKFGDITPIVGPEDGGYVYYQDQPEWGDYEGWQWESSSHMPKAAARLWLNVERIRVERLWDISDEDILAEGVGEDPSQYPNDDRARILLENRDAYAQKWGFSWDLNPWVWVVDFSVNDHSKIWMK